MKKLKLILCILLTAVCAAAVIAFAACKDSGSGGGSNLATITGISFGGDTVTYDGQAHSLEVEGQIPEGVSVEYEGNDKVEPGVYTVKATLSGEGYKTLTLTATLTIEKMTLTGITLDGDTFTYDGQVHSLEVEGQIPEGVSVAYENNDKTDAGQYTVKATLSGIYYKELILNAQLVIDKADITGITFSNDTVTYDGQAHSLAVEGNIPTGISVKYENNGKVEPGSYTVKAILSGKNYNTLELKAVLHILPNLSQVAQTVMASFGSTPDVWEFLPESFRLNEDRAYKGAQTIDFTSAVSVTNIPTTGIGKQLDVVYGTVVKMQSLLGYVDTFYGSANTIAGLYQEYINAHPDNYREFEGQTSGGAIGFRIELDDMQYKLLAKIGPASLELTSDTENNGYTGRVQISDSNALKFEVGEDTLTIALNILNHAVTQLIFVRTGSTVTCHMYETLYFGENNTTIMETSALLTWSGNYVSVCGTNGDFFLGSKGEVVELYDATTGKYLGSKVKETLSSIVYNTYWFNLSNMGGINTIRVINESHGNGTLNATSPYTVYLNGSADMLAIRNVSAGLFDTNPKRYSRRYDIEMKKTYYYTYDGEKFEKIEIEIPMIFVQEENYDTLAADILEKNSGLYITNNVPSTTTSRLDYYYESGLAAYEQIADLVTPQAIAEYVGVKDKWFN